VTAAAFTSQFLSVSVQFLGEHLKQHLLICVQEEVVSGQHSQREGSSRLLAPAIEIVAIYPAILHTAKAGDAAGERRLVRVRVCLVNCEVCPQDWKHDPHELRMLQHFSGSAVQATQLFQEFPVGHSVDWPVPRWGLRRGRRGDKQANRLNIELSPELTGKLKTNQCAKAVTKQGKWLVQEWTQGRSEGLHKGRELSEWRLYQPRPTSGELDRADLDISWQVLRPRAKNRGTGSRVRETKQAEAGLRVRLTEGDPGVQNGRVGH